MPYSFYVIYIYLVAYLLVFLLIRFTPSVMVTTGVASFRPPWRRRGVEETGANLGIPRAKTPGKPRPGENACSWINVQPLPEIRRLCVYSTTGATTAIQTVCHRNLEISLRGGHRLRGLWIPVCTALDNQTDLVFGHRQEYNVWQLPALREITLICRWHIRLEISTVHCLSAALY